VILDTDTNRRNDQVAGADIRVPGQHRLVLSENETHVSLMFHTGASLPDPSGVLEGDGDTSRVLRILNHDDLTAKTDAIRGLVTSWIQLRG